MRCCGYSNPAAVGLDSVRSRIAAPEARFWASNRVSGFAGALQLSREENITRVYFRWYNGTMRQLQSLAALALFCTGATLNVDAQPAPKTAGFRDMFLEQLKDVETKVVGLAEAMPEE